MTLPDCEWRGGQALDKRNRLRHECSHPKMTGGGAVLLVHDANCLECTYCNWNAEKLSTEYLQAKPKHVTTEEFSVRVNVCDTCEKRAGNYCTEAGGCGLIHKLRIKKFECPLRKFA